MPENSKRPASLLTRGIAQFGPRIASLLTTVELKKRTLRASSVGGPNGGLPPAGLSRQNCVPARMSVTLAQFRRMALAFPESAELSHMNHPDFRVHGKIFATIASPKEHRAMVKLTPEQQEIFIADEPSVFTPASGAWGRQGSTMVELKAAKQTTLRRAILAAWLNAAPKPLAKKFEAVQ